MTQLFLVITALAIFLLTRRVYQKNIELFLIILAVMNFGFFHLVNVLRFSSQYRLLIVPILLLIFFEYSMQKKFDTGKYGGWMGLFISLLVLGLLISAMKGQPLIMGIKSIKFYSLIMIYFFVVNHKVDNDKFVNYWLILAVIIAGLGTIQFITQSQIEIFKTVGSGLVRDNRIGEGALLISSACVFSLCNALKKKGGQYKYLYIALLAYLLFVVQTRMLLAGVLLTSLLCYFIHHRLSFKATVGLVVLVLVLSTTVVPLIELEEFKVVQQTQADFDPDSKVSSYAARVETFKYYFAKLRESLIFGHGFQHIWWSGEFILQWKGLHLSDIGAMGFVFRTGLVGFCWLFIGLGRFVFGIIRESELIVVGSYILLAMTTMLTIDMFVSEHTIFMFSLFLGLFSNEIKLNEYKPALA